MESIVSNRHLAAILFTDIVGYTTMMQRDEHAAMDAVRKYQVVLHQQVTLHHGQVQNHYGDGSLSLFPSAVQAVKCALEMQKELLDAPMVEVRMGLHIGEIYTEDGKVFGDGVNIASRIESIGQGGTVLFSKDVFEKIRNHSAFTFAFFGKYHFKNVDDRIEVYCLTNPEIRKPVQSKVTGKLNKQPTRKNLVQWLVGVVLLLMTAGYFLALRQSNAHPESDIVTEKSIAVLPFQNLSAGTNEDFLSTGIAEDILTQLAQIHDLRVISRSSSMRYKNSTKTVKTIARELGVGHILEGSVRQYGNTLRISVQLTNGKSEVLIWAEDFDRELEDILNLQKDVALMISEKLKIALRPEVKDRFAEKLNVDPEAYLYYQHGQELLKTSSGTKEQMESAIGYFEKSIQEDSMFSKAWMGLADAWLESVFWHRSSAKEALPKAREASLKALSLDSNLGESYATLGSIAHLEYKNKEAETYLRKAIELSPNYSFSHERLAWVVLYKGQVAEALALLEKAIALDPLSTRLKGSLSTAHYLVRKFDEGIKVINMYLKENPADDYLLWSLAYLQAGKGDYYGAIENLLKRSIGTTTNWVLMYCYAKTGETEKAMTILNNNIEKSKSQDIPDFMMAVQYCAIGEYEQAMDHLENCITEAGEGFFIYNLDTDPMLEPLWKEKRFNAIVANSKIRFAQ